jgi:hypothetical protein
LPICAINVTHTSESWSSLLFKSGVTSLTRKSGELGDSEGASKRIDTVAGDIEDDSVKMCESGLSPVEGIEVVNVGDIDVGGSYLKPQFQSTGVLRETAADLT